MTNYFKIALLVFAVIKLPAQIDVVTTNSIDDLYKISIMQNEIMVNGYHSYFAKSTDNCNTMSPLTIPSPVGYVNYIVKVNADTLYLLSTNIGIYNNKLYRSVDGGNNWTQKHDTSGLLLTHVVFFNDSSGIELGVSSKFMRTNDRGNTWHASGINPFGYAHVLKAFGDSTIFAGGTGSTGGGMFMISKNRGATWTAAGGILGTEARDFFFFNKDTVIATSSFGYWGTNLSISLNGGTSWAYSKLPLYSPWGIYFKNKNEGYVAGCSSTTGNGEGLVAKTTDFGQSWKVLNTHITTQLKDIQALNDSLLLISGTNGVLLKLNTKRAVFDEVVGIGENNISNINLVLSPNPVKDQLNFEFTGGNNDDLKVSISNALGQTLQNHIILTANTAIDVSNLESGIYYLKVEGKKSSKVLKIVKE